MKELIIVSLFIFSSTCWTLHDWVPKVPRGIGPRIINGEVASSHQFPWQVSMYIDKSGGSTWCGGSLINSRWVLTAGHCVYGATHFRISLGSNNLVGQDPNRVILDTIQYILHENYNPRTLANDIALVLLPEAVTFTEHIQAIALANTNLSPGITVTVSGWGLTSDSEEGPSLFLNYVSLVTISDSNCAQIYGILPSGAVCAKSTSSVTQSTCEGDSGGPLVTYTSNGPVHVGVVSFGHPDGCESNNPAAFARTHYFRNWIKEKTGV